jgi:hypothetical protein
VLMKSLKGRTEHTENRLFYGLSFCLDGQITYTFKGQKFVSNKNNAVILPKGATYTLYCNKDGLFPLINFDCAEPLCDRHIVLPLENPSAALKEYEYIKKLSLAELNYQLCLMKAFCFISVLKNILFHANKSYRLPANRNK